MYDPATPDAMASITPSSSCSEIEWVDCEDGDVVEMRLSGRGLFGALPASFGALSKLRKLFLAGNRLSGPLPPSVFASGVLQWLFISHNLFSGPMPCPTHDEPLLAK
eukprot:4001411-Pleurochrysis_carterae.AAC.1